MNASQISPHAADTIFVFYYCPTDNLSQPLFVGLDNHSKGGEVYLELSSQTCMHAHTTLTV